MSELDIDVQACRSRQGRLLKVMEEKQIELTIVTQSAHVQWLAGPWFAWTFSPLAALADDGRLFLVCPEKQMPEHVAADELLPYSAQWHSTLRNDQTQEASQVLFSALGSLANAAKVGVEYSTCGPHILSRTTGAPVDLEPDLYDLRRRKDADELARIRKAIEATRRMYEKRARQIIAPGVIELDVFNQLQAVAVDEFGEMMTGTGNDYRCGSRGGPPRSRPAEAGELYILDLGPAFRGYFADNARTIAVTHPSDEQHIAWEQILKVFQHVESSVRPGRSARALFDEVQAMLDECPYGKFNHHLGHGIGLFPHEAPHLNPFWDDTFEIGDVFTAEPGLYDAESLKAGLRIENDYLVTEKGVELLTDFPLEL